MEYTPRVNGFQIQDVTYIGKPPEDAPTKFAVVKWVKADPPFEAIDRNGKRKTVYEYCYVVGNLVWDDHEPGFDFESVGLRWLECRPDQEVVDMIMNFAHDKAMELYELS